MEKQTIYERIVKVMQEVEPIAKGRTNTQQNYKFRGVDELMNAVSPILSKHGVFPTVASVTDVSTESVTSKSGGQGWRLVRRYTFRFYAEDGSYVDTTADGEAIDYGDKASNKAYSVAYREAMFKMFVIPFQNEDIEEVSHDVAAKPAAAKPATTKPAPPKSIAQKREAMEKRIKEMCDQIALEPLLGEEDNAKYVLENTGMEFKPENYMEIGLKLKGISEGKAD
jgi:ribosomal protein L12E/L44/L45/RPP1/RPP2